MKNLLTFGLLIWVAVSTSCKKGEALNPIKLDSQTSVSTVVHDSTYYVYPTGYTVANAISAPINLGVPAYLDAKNDTVSQNFLSQINNTFQDGLSLLKTHPEYLSPKTVNTINIVSSTDLYVTFVSSNWGYKNTLAYYTYKTGKPPVTTSGGSVHGAMDTITYIFPNANASTEQGGLITGNRFKIRKLAPGTSIGFVLILAGWNGYNIDPEKVKYYGQDYLNPETVDSLKRHEILLYDKNSDRYIIGFERLNRQTESSDQDFNDVMFYVQATKPNSISNNNVALLNETGN